MRRTPQSHFTPLHRPIHQGDSETQRKPIAMFIAFGAKSVGFLYVYAGLLGLMYFEIPAFDFQHRSTQPTELKQDGQDSRIFKSRQSLVANSPVPLARIVSSPLSYHSASSNPLPVPLARFSHPENPKIL